MTTQSQAAEKLEGYLENEDNGKCKLLVPEGAFKGWLPRVLYTYCLDTLHLPFQCLHSFPVAGAELGALTSLRNFHAVGNYLCFLHSSFVKCSLVVSLDLSFNHFTEIPQPVYKLVNLEELNFAHNDIEQVTEDIGELINLRYLNLAGNTLNSLPDDIANCGKIQMLDLSGKFYPRGKIKAFPIGVCYLHNLTELDLSWQQIECIPDEFGNLACLQRLNLKGNHLGHVSAEISKCIKLQSLNLAGALKRCSQIPEALFSLGDLRSLNLSDNYFTDIPEKVLGLCELTSLIMQRNALLRLPESLFQLQQLTHLELSENYLETLPAAVGSLGNLVHLGLERNSLTEIPEESCRMRSLSSLALASNKLTSIPESICRLSNLKILSLENNNLEELPLLLDRLLGLLDSEGLSLHGNYLRTPPQAICDQGVLPLFHFIKELRVSEASHRRKMILIGAVKAGKTSLRHALMLGHSKLTKEHERTWVLEHHLWEPEAKLRVQILDFGGHQIYQAAHHMFLTPEAFHLLVFDLKSYSPELYDECISHWLDAIMDRAPGASILLVGTHADLCSEKEIKDSCKNVLDRMETEESEKLNELRREIDCCRRALEHPEVKDSSGGKFADLGVERLQEKLSYLERMLNTRSRVPDRVFVVSCAEDLTGIEDLRENITISIKTAEERKLPHSWYRYLMDLQDNSDPILNIKQAQDIFVRVMKSVSQSLMGMGGSADRSLSMVLKYLHSTGEIVWFHDNPRLQEIVFHRPETLIQMLRAVFRHDFERVVNYSEELGRQVGISSDRFVFLKDDFVRQGLMTYELLHFTLLHFQLSADALHTFISLMLKFDLCYELTEDRDPSRVGSARILQFPWFFTEDRPTSVSNMWPQKLPSETFELCFKVKFPRKEPPYFFEKLSVRLQQYVSERYNWKNGVLACLNYSYLLVTRQRHCTEDATELKVAVRGAVDLQELWALLKQTRAEMLVLLQDWPFIQPIFTLVCSHCLLLGYEDPFTFPAEVLDKTMPANTFFAHFCRKHLEDNVPACLIYPLDKDYQDNIEKHMAAATQFLQSVRDNVDGLPDVLSDVDLAFIASRLGKNWIHLMLELRVPIETVEQIEMSFPNNTYRQILQALKFWRDMPVQGFQPNAAGDARQDKISQLLKTLGSDGIDNFDLVEELRARFQIEQDD